MKSFYPDPKWQWFWRLHLLISLGILFLTIALDVGLASVIIAGPEFPAQADPAQVEAVRSDLTTWLTWAIPGDLILVPLTVAQYGFCAQRKYFTRFVAAATFWIALLYVAYRLVLMIVVLMTDFPGYQFVLLVRLFLVFELIVMWLYIYRSPHLWMPRTSVTI